MNLLNLQWTWNIYVELIQEEKLSLYGFVTRILFMINTSGIASGLDHRFSKILESFIQILQHF